MSYDPTTAECFHCEKRIDLALMEHEIREGEPVHAKCAKEIDADAPNPKLQPIHVHLRETM